MKRCERIKSRYRENLRLLPRYSEYIYDQQAPNIRNLRYGGRGTVGENGCGAVALHNVMRFIGREQNFCDLLCEMEELRMPWFGARLGTKPYALGRYFVRHKIPYWKYSAPTDFKAKLLSHRIGIVCTWNPHLLGMHFYCVYYSNEENKYYTANLHPTTKTFAPTRLDAIVNRRFVVGYILK